MKNKSLLLENGNISDIPSTLINYCRRNNIEWEHYDMRERFWKENKQKTIQYFSSLPVGSKLICQTVFDGTDQLELMINLLYFLKDHNFEVKIYMNYLCEELTKWYDRNTADTTPKELQLQFDKETDRYKSKDLWEQITQYKKDLNFKFDEVLKMHQIIWIGTYREDIRLNHINQIKQLYKNEIY